MPPEWIDEKTAYLINPTGRFVISGGRRRGITGRKIICDTTAVWADTVAERFRKGSEQS
jgi:S-adenosylmethionine synthetase